MSGIDKGRRNLARKVIQRTVRDASIEPDHRLISLAKYVNSSIFNHHVEIANYPAELRDTLSDMFTRSRSERKVIGGEILTLLKVWDDTKKTPQKEGPFNRIASR